jgi:GTP-binding protein
MKITKSTFIKSIEAYDNRGLSPLSEIAFIGRSNVGKSSMINRLVMQKIARTSSTPGRTRSINIYKIDYEFKNAKRSFYISDFPGFGYSKVSKSMYRGWQEMIERYILENRNIKRLLWLFDVRRDFDALDDMLIDWLEANRLPYSFVVTKTDKVTRNELALKKTQFAEMFGKDNVFIFSAKSGYGRKELLLHIFSTVG